MDRHKKMVFEIQRLLFIGHELADAMLKQKNQIIVV
jgi:hypothetical protein